MASVGTIIQPDDLTEALDKVKEAIDIARTADDTIPEFTWVKPMSSTIALDLLTFADASLTSAAEKYQAITCNVNNTTVNKSKYTGNNSTQCGTVKKSKMYQTNNTHCTDQDYQL